MHIEEISDTREMLGTNVIR